MRFLGFQAALSVVFAASQAHALIGPFFNGQIPGFPNFAPSLSNNTYDYVVVGGEALGNDCSKCSLFLRNRAFFPYF